MKKLHSLVCVKIVPKPEEIRVDPDTNLLLRDGVRSEINPPDMNAMEMALLLKDRYGGRISIVSMGPANFEPFLRTALAMGADHVYLLSDRAFGGADTLATTYTLAQGVKKIGGVNLIFCGEESSDGATGQVPPGLAEWLGVNQLTMVSEIELDLEAERVRGRREIKGGYEILEVPLPSVISVRMAANEPRFINYRIKTWAYQPEQVTVWSSIDLGAELDCIGQSGSPTWVSGLAQAKTRERRRQFLQGSPEEIARQLFPLLRDRD